MDLLPLIRLFEGKDNVDRRQVLIRQLDKLKISYAKESFDEGINIIVTKKGKVKKQILAVCHYDPYPGSPGANDNASAVVVLLDALRRLKTYKQHYTYKVIFFDREEPRCLGSKAYVNQHGINDIVSVLNLELVGRGDVVAVWPVKGMLKNSRLLDGVHRVCKQKGLPYEDALKVPMFNADYKPFRKAGIQESVCLSLIPKEQADEVRKFATWSVLGLSIMLKLGFMKIPEFFEHYHSESDTSDYLREKDLQKMANLVCGILKDLDKS